MPDPADVLLSHYSSASELGGPAGPAPRRRTLGAALRDGIRGSRWAQSVRGKALRAGSGSMVEAVALHTEELGVPAGSAPPPCISVRLCGGIAAAAGVGACPSFCARAVTKCAVVLSVWNVRRPCYMVARKCAQTQPRPSRILRTPLHGHLVW